MKYLLTAVALTVQLSIFAQDSSNVEYEESAPDSTVTAADTIKIWDDMDLATTKWQEVKHVFVPEDLKTNTLLLETHTLEQHQAYFKKLVDAYYLANDIDTSVAKYAKGMSHYIKDQEKEVHYFKHHYKGTIAAINEEEIADFNTDEYRYVLKKILKVDEVDPKTGHGAARIEYYFYDRKEKKEFPHINAKFHWLVTHLNH